MPDYTTTDGRTVTLNMNTIDPRIYTTTTTATPANWVFANPNHYWEPVTQTQNTNTYWNPYWSPNVEEPKLQPEPEPEADWSPSEEFEEFLAEFSVTDEEEEIVRER